MFYIQKWIVIIFILLLGYQAFASQKVSSQSKKNGEAQLFVQGLKKVVLFFHGLGIKKGQVFFGAALAFWVDGLKVRAAGNEEPDDLAAVFGVAHKRGDLGKDAVRCAVVALLVPVAEKSVSLISEAE